MRLTYRYRIKQPRGLAELACAVNYVWNYCGETHRTARRRGRRPPTRFDLNRLVAGAAAELGLHSDTLQDVARWFTTSCRTRHRRPRWRTSRGPRRSLGWIPFACGRRAIQLDQSGVTYRGRRYRLWFHRPLGGRVCSGSFSEDARGRWYLNLVCDVAVDQACGEASVGIDLGLLTLATTSAGEKIENPRHTNREAERLATAQRAGRKARTRALHAKIAARRKHHLHVVTAALVRRYGLIVVGDCTLPAGKQSRDAGWAMLRGFLRYKALRHGAIYREVSERFSTQTCAECGLLGGPKGLEGLRVRMWQCSGCGALLDRDVNAARNLLCSGQSADLQVTESPGLVGEGITPLARLQLTSPSAVGRMRPPTM